MEVITNKDGTTSFREMIWINGRSVKSPCFRSEAEAETWKKVQKDEIQKIKSLAVNENILPKERSHCDDCEIKIECEEKIKTAKFVIEEFDYAIKERESLLEQRNYAQDRMHKIEASFNDKNYRLVMLQKFMIEKTKKDSKTLELEFSEFLKRNMK